MTAAQTVPRTEAMQDYKTIKTRPREVRGRVMHVAGKASSGAAYFSADRLRAIRREAQVRKQKTKPKCDAVSNVEDQVSQTAEKLPYAAYRLKGKRLPRRRSKDKPLSRKRSQQSPKIWAAASNRAFAPRRRTFSMNARQCS